MISISKKAKCNGCHACFAICPKRCISMVVDKEGFFYPKIDKQHCIDCGLCEKICPTLNKMDDNNKKGIAYAAINKDAQIRMNSSSGGAFFALATKIIEQGGVVFGASFNENFELVHTYAETLEEVQKFCGAKYIQSKIGESYCFVEQFLKNGRIVLFTGTPCQIGGLRAYLQKEYDNLFTQDLICHGVPSPLVWEKYKEYRKKKDGRDKPEKIMFRSKEEGWKKFSLVFSYSDMKYRECFNKDLYMKLFLNNLCLRPSCYECAFKTDMRASDLTLADFWGIKNILPKMDDDKGTSLIFVNSPKGQELFDSIKLSFNYKEVCSEEAIIYNSAMIQSVKLPTERKAVMRKIAQKGLKDNNSYFKASLCNRIKNFLGRFYKKK